MTAHENSVMRMAVKATLLRAAAIIDKITESDLLKTQQEMLAQGMNLESVAKLDRAMIASAHLRVLAEELDDFLVQGDRLGAAAGKEGLS